VTATAEISAERDGSLLLGWLGLLGWSIELEDGGDRWVGTARHLVESGDDITVSAAAESRSALAWQLFRGALCGLEAGDRTPGSSLRAA